MSSNTGLRISLQFYYYTLRNKEHVFRLGLIALQPFLPLRLKRVGPLLSEQRYRQICSSCSPAIQTFSSVFPGLVFRRRSLESNIRSRTIASCPGYWKQTRVCSKEHSRTKQRRSGKLGLWALSGKVEGTMQSAWLQTEMVKITNFGDVKIRSDQ